MKKDIFLLIVNTSWWVKIQSVHKIHSENKWYDDIILFDFTSFLWASKLCILILSFELFLHITTIMYPKSNESFVFFGLVSSLAIFYQLQYTMNIDIACSKEPIAQLKNNIQSNILLFWFDKLQQIDIILFCKYQMSLDLKNTMDNKTSWIKI
jgi:hypothetical protein